MKHPPVADYVVVAAGSAGSIIATRLASAGASVILVEAGGTDRRPDVALPLGIVTLYATANWKYPTAPEPGKEGQTSAFASGRIIGGSGSINAMVYARGRRSRLRRSGRSRREWVVPPRCAPPLQGAGDLGQAPMNIAADPAPSRCPVVRPPPRDRRRLHRGRRRGRPSTQSGSERFGSNGGGPYPGEPAARASQFVWSRIPRPCPPRAAPAGPTRSTVTRVVVEHGGAVGIQIGGRVIRARQEVVLCAGAIGSAALSINSGIAAGGGVANLPGVGENFHDHLVVTQGWASKVPTINTMGAVRAAKALREFIARGEGALTTTPFEAQIFTDDFQIAVSPVRYEIYPVTGRVKGEALRRLHGVHGADASRGSRSGPHEGRQTGDRVRPPRPARGRAKTVGGRGATRDLVESQPAMRGVTGANLSPTGDHARRRSSSAESSIYHVVGTCRREPDDMSVVGPDLRVHGINGLRVADASVTPAISSGNTNAPTMMIAVRAVDLILGAASVH